MFRNLILMGLVAGTAFGQIQLVRPSVAATDDPLANISNPAGLGFTPHTETMIFGHYNGEKLTKDFAFYSQNKQWGFGYEWNTITGKNIWTQSYGFKLSGAHALGMTYSFNDALWKEGRLNLGWMYRPIPYLSLGASVTNVWSGVDAYKTINTGIALQNKTGRFGLNIDGAFLLNDSGREPDIQTSTYTGLFVEPVEGLRITGYADISGATPQYGISLSFFMPEFGVESHSNPEHSSNQTFGFRTSVNPYRTVFKGTRLKKDQQTYVRMHLDGLFIEEPESKKPPFNIKIPFFDSNNVYGKQLKKFIDDMAKLTNDKSVNGLIIDLGYVRGGFSKLAEIRNALQKFHDAGKKIIVYSKAGLSNKGVFLTSMADEIYTHEMGGADLKGLNLEITFYRGLLDTLSIIPEVWRISPYKTAGDRFMNRTMSAEMRENYSQLFDGIYREFVAGIAEGKGWSVEETRTKIDEGPYMLAPEAIAAGLITDTKYPDEFEDYVEKLNDGKNTIIKFDELKDISDYVYGWRPDADKEKIAVIYAVGGIATGKSKPSPAGSKVMGDETISEAIKQAREDKDIKAIVLRIDSGGGSALASDVMWREALKTTETDSANIKPFIASLSSVAASGGYYIACQADSIIAAPSTITGSIGVIGMRLNFSKLKERIGLHTDQIKFGERSDFASGSRLATEEESKMIMESIQDIYVTFKKRVLKGRANIDDIDALDTIALGRVWTGTDAVKNGLIDKTGGYYDAIELAKAAAGIEGEVEIVEYPKRDKKSNFSDLMSVKADLNILPEELRESIDALEIIRIIGKDQIQMILPVKIEIK